MESLFSLKNISAGYVAGKPVVQIENLNFKKRKLTFLLGKSGIGKSTLLELLALMNNTLFTNSNSSFEYNNDQANSSYFNLWKLNDDKLASFRNENFSFIFQSNNLMKNFTAGENMCFTKMMQGTSLEDAKSIAEGLMEDLDLKKERFNDPINRFSGGQRQRLSFIRALIPDYKVLFADEPTGNLDVKNAKQMMDTLDKDLRNKKASAVIVTHHLGLAIQYADQIMLITKKENTGEEVIGEVIEENIHNRSAWENDPVGFKKYLEKALK